MKLGISSYSLTWSIGVPGYPKPENPITAMELVRIAHHNKLQIVQIVDNLPLHTMSDAELYRLAEYSSSCGITLEIGTRGTDPAHMLEYLRIAVLLGASLFRTLITDQELTGPTSQLLQVLPNFREAGVTIAVENHGLHTTRQLSALFQAIDSPYVGCCMDTVNSFSALDSPDRVAEDLIPFICNLHIKDFEITRIDHQMGFMVLGKAAGYGKLDIPTLLDRIAAADKNPSAILELWTPYTGSLEETIQLEQRWFKESLAYLTTLPGLE